MQTDHEINKLINCIAEINKKIGSLQELKRTKLEELRDLYEDRRDWLPTPEEKALIQEQKRAEYYYENRDKILSRRRVLRELRSAANSQN